MEGSDLPPQERARVDARRPAPRAGGDDRREDFRDSLYAPEGPGTIIEARDMA